MEPFPHLSAEASGKSGGAAAGLLATLTATFGASAVNKAFAGILSQITVPPVAVKTDTGNNSTADAPPPVALAVPSAAPNNPPDLPDRMVANSAPVSRAPDARNTQNTQKTQEQNGNNPSVNTQSGKNGDSSPPSAPVVVAQNSGDKGSSPTAQQNTDADDDDAVTVAVKEDDADAVDATAPGPAPAADSGLAALPAEWAQILAFWQRNLAPVAKDGVADPIFAASAVSSVASPATGGDVVAAASSPTPVSDAASIPAANDAASPSSLKDILAQFVATAPTQQAQGFGDDDASKAQSAAPVPADVAAAVSPTNPASAAAPVDFSQTKPANEEPKESSGLKNLLASLARQGLAAAKDGGVDGDVQNPAPAEFVAAFSARDRAALADSMDAAGKPPRANGKTDWVNDDRFNLFSSFNPATAGPNAGDARIGFAPAYGATGAALNFAGDETALNMNRGGQGGAATDAGLPTNSNLAGAATARGATPYDFASQLSAARSTHGGAAGLPPAVEQVALQMSRNLKNGGSGDMTIQLRPAELGRIDVKISIAEDGSVRGIVKADNPATLQLLLKDVGSLERALQDAGLRADSGSLQFGLRGEGQAGGQPGEAFRQQAQGEKGATHDVDAALEKLGALTDVETEMYYVTPGRVNLRV